MNRRRFLAWLGGTAAGVAAASTLDLDRLLWKPDERTIFLPPEKPQLWTPTKLTRGDIFTIDGVFAVHPITGANTRLLQQFVITADVTANSGVEEFYPPRMFGQYGPNYTPIPPQSKAQPLLWGRTIAEARAS